MLQEDELPTVEHRSAFDTIPCPPPWARLQDSRLQQPSGPAPTAPETGALQFPAGAIRTSRPTREQLQDSAIAWLGMAQTQLGSVRYWAEQCDRTHETLKSLDVLASHLAHMRRALVESEHVR